MLRQAIKIKWRHNLVFRGMLIHLTINFCLLAIGYDGTGIKSHTLNQLTNTCSIKMRLCYHKFEYGGFLLLQIELNSFIERILVFHCAQNLRIIVIELESVWQSMCPQQLSRSFHQLLKKARLHLEFLSFGPMMNFN